MAPQTRKTPRVLDEHEFFVSEIELTHANAPPWLKKARKLNPRHKKWSTRKREISNQDPRKYQKLNSFFGKMDLKLFKCKRDIGRSGVAFRSEKNERKLTRQVTQS